MKILVSTFLLAGMVLWAVGDWAQVAAAPAVDGAAQKQIASMEARLADWAQLARYREDDAKLGDPKPGEQRVVFLGASITDFWGRRYGSFFPGRPYVNRGISGQTTSQLLVRFQQDVVHLRPAVVLICDAGANDIAGNTGPFEPQLFKDNIVSMVAIARANHIRVILASLLPASRFPWKPEARPAEEIRAMNDWLRSYAAEQHLVYLNYYDALVDGSGGMRTELAFDGAVHPNAAGYAIMAPLAQAAIDKVLKGN